MIGGYKGGMEKLHQSITEKMEKLVDGKCCVQLRSCSREKIPEMHEELRKYACKVLECRPIVLEARKYIHANYQRRELDLTQVADATGCNASYLSRMMKQELGISFKDFLTTLRINQAIFLMRDCRSIRSRSRWATAISIIFQRHSKTARAFPRRSSGGQWRRRKNYEEMDGWSCCLVLFIGIRV